MSRVCARGHVNADTDAFCKSCGLALGSPSAPPPPATPAPQPGAPAPQPGFGAQGYSGPGFAAPGYGAAPGMAPGSPAPFGPPARTGMSSGRIIAITVGAVIAGLGALLLIVNNLGGGTRTVAVNFTVYGVDNCEMGLGYIDVPGSAVTIEADGEFAGISSLSRFGDDVGYGCMFTASVADVPTDASVYSIEVGRRGVITNTQSELEGNGWAFDLSLGD